MQKVDNLVKSSMEMRLTLLPYNNTCNDHDLYVAVKVLIAEMFGWCGSRFSHLQL